MQKRRGKSPRRFCVLLVPDSPYIFLTHPHQLLPSKKPSDPSWWYEPEGFLPRRRSLALSCQKGNASALLLDQPLFLEGLAGLFLFLFDDFAKRLPVPIVGEQTGSAYARLIFRIGA